MKIDLDREIAFLEKRKAKLLQLVAIQSEVIQLELKMRPETATESQLHAMEDAVCKFYEIPMQAITGRSRIAQYVEARHVLCWLLQRLYGCGPSEIGRRINRDHGTVINGLKSVKERMDTEKEFAGKVDRLLGAYEQSSCKANGV